MVELELPWPPTINHYWRRVGARTLISREGRRFRETVLAILAETSIVPRRRARLLTVATRQPMIGVRRLTDQRPSVENVMFTRFRLAILLLVPTVLLAAWAMFMWTYARVEVEPDTFVVVTNRWGKELPTGELVAPDSSYKGIQRRVLPAGRHFLNPLFYTWERHPLVKVEEKHCAVLIRLSGVELSAERKAKNQYLAHGAIDLTATEKPGERGIVEQVLVPANTGSTPMSTAQRSCLRWKSNRSRLVSRC